MDGLINPPFLPLVLGTGGRVTSVALLSLTDPPINAGRGDTYPNVLKPKISRGRRWIGLMGQGIEKVGGKQLSDGIPFFGGIKGKENGLGRMDNGVTIALREGNRVGWRKRQLTGDPRSFFRSPQRHRPVAHARVLFSPPAYRMPDEEMLALLWLIQRSKRVTKKLSDLDRGAKQGIKEQGHCHTRLISS